MDSKALFEALESIPSVDPKSIDTSFIDDKNLKDHQKYKQLYKAYITNIEKNNVKLKKACHSALKLTDIQHEYIYKFWLDILKKNKVPNILSSKKDYVSQYKEEFPLKIEDLLG